MPSLSNLSVRKQRLLACALCRRIWDLLADERSRRGVEVAERYADGLATDEELALARVSAWKATEVEAARGLVVPAAAAAAWATTSWTHGDVMDARGATLAVAELVVQAVVWAKASWKPSEVAAHVRAEEEHAQQKLLEDVECPTDCTLDPAMLTQPAVALAATVYSQRSFDRLPELVAALEAIGCTDVSLLAHLRSQEPHCRGCWGIDLLLKKS